MYVCMYVCAFFLRLYDLLEDHEMMIMLMMMMLVTMPILSYLDTIIQILLCLII